MSRFFFVDELPDLGEKSWQPPLELARHIRALRISIGSEVVLLPQIGGGVVAQLLENGNLFVKSQANRPEIDLPDISLASAWPKGSRGDDLIRRATELGALRIVPLTCERSVTGKNDLSSSKVSRWHKISKEVCQQCRRPDLPIIDGDLMSLKQLATEFKNHQLICLSPSALPLQQTLANNSKPILLIVGPEGGLSTDEENLLKQHGAVLASIGPTILRIEAAGPSAIAIASHCLQSK
jgi:16S rRNA (uracil1498-N3)-methyltransferase